MAGTQKRAAKLLSRLALVAPLLLLCAHATTQARPSAAMRARQQQQPAQQQQPNVQQPAQRTGRSYDTNAPARKPPTPAPQAQSPVTFTDITAQSGVRFRQSASPTSQKYLPETMGGGVALFDYVND